MKELAQSLMSQYRPGVYARDHPLLTKPGHCMTWFTNGIGNNPEIIHTQSSQANRCCGLQYEYTVCAASACMPVACVNCIIYLILIKMTLSNTQMNA